LVKGLTRAIFPTLKKYKGPISIGKDHKARIEISSRRIEDKLKIEQVLRKVPIIIDHSWIMKGADFGGTRILDAVRIDSCLINGDLFLREGTFEVFSLNNSTIEREVDAREDSCISFLSVDKTIFKDYVNFNTLISLGDSYFHRTEFRNGVSFYNSQFDTAIFQNTKFNGVSTFDEVKFNKYAYFGNATFFKEVSFEGATFGENVIFDNTTFLGAINFSKVISIAKRIDLTFIKTDTAENSNTRVGINLFDSDISKIKIDYQKFKLLIPPNSPKEKVTNVYQALLFNFKNDGFLDSYQDLDKEYQEYLYIGHRDSKWYHHIFNETEKLWWDYGYDRGRPIYWSILLVIIFAIINFFLYERLNVYVYNIENLPTEIPKGSKVGVIVKKIYFSLIYSAVIFFSLNVKTERLKFDKWLLLTYFFIKYTIGIICLAYIANYVLKL